MLIDDFVYKEFMEEIKVNVGIFGMKKMEENVQKQIMEIINERNRQYKDKMHYMNISENENYSKKIYDQIEVIKENKIIEKRRYK